jgi:hypothetical protein
VEQWVQHHRFMRKKHGLFGSGILMAIGIGAVIAVRRYAHAARELDSRREEPVVQHNFEVSVGDHVFLEEGGEEVGAVRRVERDHLVVYIEAAGDFIVRGPEVKAAHDGKVVLAADLVDPKLLEAARGAHEREADENRAGRA